ncbi:transposase [Streptomyces pharetrae]|uniref:transposase n=1 Tax=Streptomyces pharetrae TaxID=291370 RepID=UPI003D9E77F3
MSASGLSPSSPPTRGCSVRAVRWRRRSDRRVPGTFPRRIHQRAPPCRRRTMQTPPFVLTPGHYGDGPQFERVLDQISVSRPGVGRPRTQPDRVLADKAYTSRSNRRYLRRRGIPHTIPERLDQQRHGPNRNGST